LLTDVELVRSADAIDLKLNILTSGYWPNQVPGPCEIPPVLKVCQLNFEEFYNQKHHGRKLTWYHSNGQ